MIEISAVKTDEDIELVKGLLGEYITSWFEFDGFVYEKNVNKKLKHKRKLRHGLIRNDLKRTFINSFAA